MYKRFLDNKNLFSEEKDFVVRNYGNSRLFITCIYAIVCVAVTACVYFTHDNYPIISQSSIISGMLSLLLFTLFITMKQNNLINKIELQNLLFAGSAKLNNDIFVLIKSDGNIAYIDPELERNFTIEKNKGLKDFPALCKTLSLSKKNIEKLNICLNEGLTESISGRYSIAGNKSKKPLKLELQPVDIFENSPYENNLNLAVNPITRPSGYFLLRQVDDFKISQLGSDTKAYLKKNILEKYLDKISIPAYSITKKGEIGFVNNSFSEVFGYSKDDINNESINFLDIIENIGDNDPDFDHTNEWQGNLVLKNKALGTVNTFAAHNNFSDINNTYGLVFSLNKNIENHLIETLSNDDIPDLLMSSPLATVIIDSRGNVKNSNNVFRNFYGIENPIQNLLEIISTEDHTKTKNFINDAKKNLVRPTNPLDIKIDYKKDEKTALLYINKINFNNTDSTDYVIHLIDTTEQKNLELRFVHSQKMQAVGQLAGGIAHDFNNLLTAMMGFCDLLLMRHPAGDASFADIMQIKQNANRAANLIRQLLAFSRKQTLQPNILNLTDVLADLTNLIGRLIGENIELKMEHGRDLYDIKADQVQLEQVIINLAVNARDAMPEGGTLKIKTRNVTIDNKHKIPRNLIAPVEDDKITNGKYVLVEVSDDGCGIDKDSLDKIFEPFFSTKEMGSGTGLGLSTVYGIIKQTDGYIYVSSIPGKGSKFSIYFKKDDSEKKPPVDVIKDSEQQNKNLSPDLTGTGTILLVEDETPVRIFSTNALKNKGYTVLEADSGEAALRLLKEHKNNIDVIITDVVMPGISGPDMIEKISETLPDVKVIFISGYAEDTFKKTYGENRRFNFLSKPYTLKQLASKVKEVTEDNKKD